MPIIESHLGGWIERRMETFDERRERLESLRSARDNIRDSYFDAELKDEGSDSLGKQLSRMLRETQKLQDFKPSTTYYLRGRWRIPFIGRDI